MRLNIVDVGGEEGHHDSGRKEERARKRLEYHQRRRGGVRSSSRGANAVPVHVKETDASRKVGNFASKRLVVGSSKKSNVDAPTNSAGKHVETIAVSGNQRKEEKRREVSGNAETSQPSKKRVRAVDKQKLLTEAKMLVQRIEADEAKERQEADRGDIDNETEAEAETKVGFHTLGLSDELVGHLKREISDGGLGLEYPTAVQRGAIPALLQGQDVLIKSETGSGKTLAFALPIMHKLHRKEPRLFRSDGIHAVILSPTRELCVQICQVFQSLARRFHWIVIGSIVGGEKRKSEKARLRKGFHILVATPGRFVDHLEKTASLQQGLRAGCLEWLVLDEADRLTDAGFMKQIDRALEVMDQAVLDSDNPRNVQNVLVSATMSDSVKALAEKRLHSPVRVDICKGMAATSNVQEEADDASRGLVSTEVTDSYTLPKQLVQHYVVCESKQRLVALCAFVLRQVTRSSHTSKIIVFVSCRAVVEFLHASMAKVEWPPHQMLQKLEAMMKNSESEDKNGDQTNQKTNPMTGLGTKWLKLHGSMEQRDRRKTIAEFTKAKGGVLICTDVVARGLDLPSVDWIIQYDLPSEVEEYVHRVGRTARSGRKGSALMFLRPKETEYIDILKSHGILKLKAIETSSIFNSLVVINSMYKLKKSAGALPTGSGIMARAMYNASDAAELLQIKLEDLVSDTKSPPIEKGDHDDVVNPAALAKTDKASKGSQKKQPTPLLLKELAENAFLASIRAYAVHSKETKHIFHPKALHLGHEARAFGLREQPKGVSNQARSRLKEKRKIGKVHQEKRAFQKRARYEVQNQTASEFS